MRDTTPEWRAAIYNASGEFVREVDCEVDGMRVVPHLNPDTDRPNWTLVLVSEGCTATTPLSHWLP